MNKARLASLLILFQMAVVHLAAAEGLKSTIGPDRIHGTITFVERKGLAPMTMAPFTYWSVVVHGDGMDYELSHVSGIDSGVSPESVTIQGTVIHPGDEVTIEGKAQRIRKDFGLLSEIGKVDVN